MRVMAYLGTLVLLLALWGGWLLHRGKLRSSQAVPVAVGVGGDHAVPDEHRGLAVDRERPPAVDRAGPAEDRQRELAVGQRHRDLDQPDRVRAGLHRARRRRSRPDAALLPPRPGPGRRRGRRADAAPARRPRAHLLIDAASHDLVHHHRHLLDRLLRARGVRLRRRRTAHVDRPVRDRAARRDQHDRPVVGRQRGVADRRRRRDVRGVSRLVRDDVLGAVPRARARARGAVRARRLVRVPRQARRRSLAHGVVVGADDRQRPDPAADRRRPRRPADRAADQLTAQLHRELLRPADRLRADDRRDAADAVPAARRDVPGAAHDRRDPRSRPRRGARASGWSRSSSTSPGRSGRWS